MKNPKTFMATPNSHFKPVDKSATGSGDLKHNATRPWKGATSMDHFKPVRKSGHDNIGNPYATAGDRDEMMTSMSHFKPTAHSMPMAPVQPKKWHKKGYAMTSPS